MNNVSTRVQYYEKRREEIISGKVKPIPFFGLPRLNKYIPGLIPGILFKITSHSGIGKSNFAKFAFVYQPILYAIKYNVKFQVIYFALEESEEEFIDGLFLHILQRKYKISIDRFSLNGSSTTPMTEDVLKAVKMAEKDVALMMSYIKVVDNCYEPDDIYNKCRYFAEKMGKFIINPTTKVEEYIPNDPNNQVLVICDHISLIEEQYDKESNTRLTLHKSIARWHTRYARKIISKQWKWTVLNVQQQSLESEKQQFTSKGDSILTKILPSLDGLGDNKTVLRDDYVVLGLFAPDRYDIEEFRGYKIKNDPNAFGDRFRSLQVLKNRLGTPNKTLPLYFDGRYGYFEELPDPTDKIKLQPFYDKLKK